MSEIFGILDILESVIVDGRKIPMTEKVIVNEHQVLTLIEKARMVLKSKGDVAWQAVDLGANVSEMGNSAEDALAIAEHEFDDRKSELLRIRDETRQYADNVMAQLQLTVTKMQTQLIKMESTIRNGRDLIESADYAQEDSRS